MRANFSLLRVLIIIGLVFFLAGCALRLRSRIVSKINKPSDEPQPAQEQVLKITPALFNAGYRVMNVSIPDERGKLISIRVSVWYPTNEDETPYAYDTVGVNLQKSTYQSALAINASIEKNARPYPLALFFHGGTTCGTQSVFLTEHLARQGYIAAAPDFYDHAQMCKSGGGSADRRLVFLRALKEFKGITQQSDMLALLSENMRVPGASGVLDALLAENKQPNSFLYNAINENAIGVVGHSYGGMTILGMIGAHPNPSYLDARIKAAVLLSSPVFPFSKENLSKVAIPIIVMQGDDEDNTDEWNIPRKHVYDYISGKKIYLKLGNNALHGAFFNGTCDGYGTIQECQIKNPFVRAIDNYTTTLFNKYLLQKSDAEAALNVRDAIVKEYVQQ